MLKITSPTWSSGVLLSSIDMAKEDEFGNDGSNGMKFIIMSKKSIRADYLNFKGTVGIKGFECLILDAKKAFNHLRHAFIKALILQHFDLEYHIWVETDKSGHAIGRVLS